MRGGGAAAVTDASATFTINLTNVTELNSIHGQRSFVRYLDILFDQGASDLLNLISNNRLRLTRFDLDGNNGTIVPLPTTTAVGSQIQLDFGAQGIGGNRNTNVGDGYYQIAVDMDQNGSFETVKSFHRLLGDMNGNGIVDAADKTKILLAHGTPCSAENDANRDGAVNITDTSLVTRAFGRKLKNTLFPLDDDELSKMTRNKSQRVAVAFEDRKSLRVATMQNRKIDFTSLADLGAVVTCQRAALFRLANHLRIPVFCGWCRDQRACGLSG